MENNQFFIQENVDLNDMCLNIHNEKETKVQKNTKSNPQTYMSMMQKFVREHEMFKILLDEMKPIDFEMEAIGQDIIKLRQNLNDSADLKSRENIERKIEKLKPNNLQKYVIVIRVLLALTEKKGFGMGISNDDFYYYNGRFWEKKDNDILMGFLGTFAEVSGLDPLEAQQFKVKECLFKQFQTSATIPGFNSKESEIRIPVLNGTLTFVGGTVKLEGFKKEHFLKYQLQFDYNPEAKAPIWQKFLNRVLPNKDIQNILLEFLGYIFIKDMKLEKMLLLYGFGGNGKSVINSIVCALLGNHNITSFTLSSLCDPRSQTRAFIENTLLNFSQEIGSGKYDIDILKTLSSNQPYEVKKLYKNPYIMSNYGRLAFNCNSLPKNPENTDAFYRRLIILPFNETISEEEKDIHLTDTIIEKELSGVFNLILDGMKRLKEQKDFTKSEIVNAEIKKYRKESSSLLSFLDDENYQPSPDNKMANETFYQIYKDYCIRNGFHPFGLKKLNGQLRDMGFEVNRSTNGYYHVFCEKKIFGFDFDGATIIHI